MIVSPQQAAAKVDVLSRALAHRQADVEKYEAYYSGQHSLKFATDEFRKAFGGLFATFADNWCQVVVDACAERLEVVGFRAEGQRKDDGKSWRLWREQGLDTDSDLAETDSLVTGRAFALAWPGRDGPEMTFEHASQAIVEYEPGSRRQRRSGMKWWADDDFEYATLYTPTDAWKFQRRRSTPDGRRLIVPTGVLRYGEGGWEPREVDDEPWPLPHDLGAVPLVELPNRPRLAAEPMSDIANVAPLQDAVNLLWAELMTAADAAAFPQRVVLGMERPVVPIYGPNGDVVGERPLDLEKFHAARVAWLEGENAQIAEWKAADLTNYTKVIEKAVQHIAAQTRTPPHYLLGEVVNVSGEALTAAETGLVSRVREKQRNLSTGLREFMRLGHLAAGDAEAADRIAHGSVRWADPEHRSFGELVDGTLKLTQILPTEAILERLGYDDIEITRLMEMRAREVADPTLERIARELVSPGGDTAGE